MTKKISTFDALSALLLLVSLFIVGILISTEQPTSAQGFRSPVSCDSSVAVSMSTATTTEMVALTAGLRIHVCGFALSGGGATTAKFVRGTGSNCAGSPADVTAPFEFADNTSLTYGHGIGTIFRLPTATALCITNAQAVALSGVITYTKF